MTDFEINKRLAELLGYKVFDLTLPHGKIVTVMRKTYQSDVCKIPLKDYCNSWDDMGPIIVDLEIEIRFNQVHDVALAGKVTGRNYYPYETDINPLRAAALVAIKVLEARL